MRRIGRWILLVVVVLIAVNAGLRLLSPSRPTGPVIGIVEIEGTIGEGGDRLERGAAGTRAVIEQLEEAAGDPRVSAVVIRIESPGGSPAASQEIVAAIERVRATGRPVVASLGQIATSAAYHIATAAERIVANPATTTGSIGTIMHVVTFGRALDNWGIDVEILASGEHKASGSPFRPLTGEEREVLLETLYDIHDQFVEAVAKGRGLSVERVRELADGRIFSGRQALALGLVDELGGLQDSVRLASQLAGLEEVPPTIYFRKAPPLWERLLVSALSPLSGWIRQAGLPWRPAGLPTAPPAPGPYPAGHVWVSW